MSKGLYHYPEQPDPVHHANQAATGIAMKVVPNRLSLADPVMLRHGLSLMIVVHNMFHVFLCWRQRRLCKRTHEPPPEMLSVMPPDIFQQTRKHAMLRAELQLVNYIIDAIFSCVELYFGVFPYLWKVTMRWYHDIGGDIWHNMCFMAIFSTYMTMRQLPIVFYHKLVLEPLIGTDADESLPLIGIMCAFAFLIVLVQIVLVPLTAIFIILESSGGRWFVLYIWGFILIVSMVVLIIFTVITAPFLGRTERLPEGSLRAGLKDLLAHFKFPADRVYVLKSMQTNNAQAFAWGCCCLKRVILLDNVLWNHGKSGDDLFEDEAGKGLKDDQIVGYVAHELCHWRYFHFCKTFIMLHITLIIYLMLFGTVYHYSPLYEAAGFVPNYYPHVVGYWLTYKYVMPPYLTLSNWVIFYILRHFEYNADACACHLGYKQQLTSALLKLFADDMDFPYINIWYQWWHHRLPSCLQRIRRIQEINQDGSGERSNSMKTKI